MSMMTDLRARLVTDATITGIVGSRIRMNRSEQSDALPRIVLHQISGDHKHHMTAATGKVTGRVQVDCHASSPIEAEALAEAVRQSLDGFRGQMNSGTFVSMCHLNNERNFYNPPHDGGHASDGVDTVQVDYLIGWTLSVPTPT